MLLGPGRDGTTNNYLVRTSHHERLPAGSEVKNLPAMQEMQEDPLEKEMAIHSSILAWEIPWTEEPAWLQSIGLQRFGHDLATKQQQEQLILSWVPADPPSHNKGPAAIHHSIMKTVHQNWAWVEPEGTRMSHEPVAQSPRHHLIPA